MRLFLILVLACMALAAPEFRTEGKLKGPPPESKPIAVNLKGKTIRCQGKLYGSTGMHNARLLRLNLKVTNGGKQKARFMLHAAVFARDGALLGGNGVQEIYGLDPGKDTTVQFDLFMPQADLKRAAFYQVVLFER